MSFSSTSSTFDQQTISCQANFSTWFPGDRNLYTCTIYRSDLSDENLNFVTFHEIGEKADDDVEALAFCDSKLSQIPENVHQTFKFLTILCVKQSNLMKITKEELEKFENLTELWLPNNNLRELDENLFENNKKIERISFSCNKLEMIGEKILEPLENLKSANFRRNLAIDAIYDEGDGENSLEKLKKAIKSCKVKRSRKLRFESRGKVKKTEEAREAILEQENFGSESSTLSQSLAKASESLRENLESLSLEEKVDESLHEVDQNPETLNPNFPRNVHAQSTILNSGESSQNFPHSGQTFVKTSRKKVQQNSQTFEDSNFEETSISQNFIEIPPNFPQLSHQDSSTQTSPSTFISDLNRFLYDESFKDFAIKVATKTFKVHKFVMAARSPTLNKMLRENPNLKGVEIPDTTDNVVETVLDFIYEDQMPNFSEIDETLMIFDLAMKLDIEKLSQAAEDKIMKNLERENSIKILEMGNKHENHRIKVAAFEIIKQIFPERKFKEKIMSDKKEMKKMLEGMKIWQKSLHEATTRFSKMSFFESEN